MGVIRQLKNFFTGKIIYPKTLTKAVYDENGERLDKILRDTMLAVDNEEYSGVEPRDADTLGGKYKAKDISNIEDKLTTLNNSLNMRYNPDTDYIQIKLDGTWHDCKFASFQTKQIINDSYIFYKEDNECTYSKSTDSIYMYGFNKETFGRVMCTSDISYDLTNVKKVIVNVADSSGETRNIAITSEKNTSYSGLSGTVKKVVATLGTVEIDVSDLSGNYYLALWIQPYGASGHSASLKVTSIVLTR